MGLNGGVLLNPNNVDWYKVFRFFEEHVDEFLGFFLANGYDVFGFFAENVDEVFDILVDNSNMIGLVLLIVLSNIVAFVVCSSLSIILSSKKWLHLL